MKKIFNTNKIIMALISIYLMVPLVMTFIYSFFTEWMDILPTGFTFKYYGQLFTDGLFWQALLRSIIISFVPVSIVTFALLLVMYVVVVYMPSLDKYIQILCTIPYAIQGIILPISVLSLYNGAPEPFSNRILMLVLTYCIVILPYVYQGIKNSLTTIETKRILEAAQLLGATRLYAFFRIVVPSLVQGLIITAMLSVAIVFGDFVIVNTIGGNYYFTAQMYLFKKMYTSGQFTGAIIVVLFLITLIISAFAFSNNSKKKELGDE